MVEPVRPSSRKEVLSLEAEANEETAARILPEVLNFIQGKDGATMCYLITLRKDGRPYGRPVWTFVEGWTVNTISQFEHLKNRHIEKNPEVAFLWTEVTPATPNRLRSVFLQGKCEIVRDAKTINDFYDRRKAATGRGDGHPDEDWTRLLLVTKPTVVRAEGFLGPLKPAVYRDFPE